MKKVFSKVLPKVLPKSGDISSGVSPKYGPELVVNGGFTSWSGGNPDSWSLVSELEVIESSEQCRFLTTGISFASISQALGLAGKTVLLSIDLVLGASGLAGWVSCRDGSSSADKIPGLGTIGRYETGPRTLTVVHTFVNDSIHVTREGSDVDLTFDNVSIKEVL